MSSAEELVQLAKQGGDTSELWERVNRLIYRWCFRYRGMAAKQYLDMGDLINTAYFGMLQAVQAFDPLRGCKFTTLLQYYVRKSVRELLGLRGKKRLPAISLDEPLNEEDFTLLDTLEDTGAAEPFEKAENLVANSFIWQEVSSLSKKQQAAIYGVFFENKTYAAIGQELGCSRENVQQIQDRGLRILRNKPSVRRYAAEMYTYNRGGYAYNHVGVESFQRTGTSATEWAVLKAELDRERAEFNAVRPERENQYPKTGSGSVSIPTFPTP